MKTSAWHYFKRSWYWWKKIFDPTFAHKDKSLKIFFSHLQGFEMGWVYQLSDYSSPWKHREVMQGDWLSKIPAWKD